MRQAREMASQGVAVVEHFVHHSVSGFPTGFLLGGHADCVGVDIGGGGYVNILGILP